MIFFKSTIILLSWNAVSVSLFKGRNDNFWRQIHCSVLTFFSMPLFKDFIVGLIWLYLRVEICVKISVEGCCAEYPFAFNRKVWIVRLKSYGHPIMFVTPENEMRQNNKFLVLGIIIIIINNDEVSDVRAFSFRFRFDRLKLAGRTVWKRNLNDSIFFYWLLPWKSFDCVEEGENGKSWFQIKVFSKELFLTEKTSALWSTLNLVFLSWICTI